MDHLHDGNGYGAGSMQRATSAGSAAPGAEQRRRRWQLLDRNYPGLSCPAITPSTPPDTPSRSHEPTANDGAGYQGVVEPAARRAGGSGQELSPRAGSGLWPRPIAPTMSTSPAHSLVDCGLLLNCTALNPSASSTRKTTVPSQKPMATGRCCRSRSSGRERGRRRAGGGRSLKWGAGLGGLQPRC